eukprot:11410796-Karenia_brevis.AAC.1
MILKQRALLGWDADEDKHITVLNRSFDMRVINGLESITYEPDPRHVDLVLRHLGLGEREALTRQGISLISTMVRRS